MDLRSPILPKEEKRREQKKEGIKKEEEERNGRIIEETNGKGKDTIDEGEMKDEEERKIMGREGKKYAEGLMGRKDGKKEKKENARDKKEELNYYNPNYQFQVFIC